MIFIHLDVILGLKRITISTMVRWDSNSEDVGEVAGERAGSRPHLFQPLIVFSPFAR